MLSLKIARLSSKNLNYSRHPKHANIRLLPGRSTLLLVFFFPPPHLQTGIRQAITSSYTFWPLKKSKHEISVLCPSLRLKSNNISKMCIIVRLRRCISHCSLIVVLLCTSVTFWLLMLTCERPREWSIIFTFSCFLLVLETILCRTHCCQIDLFLSGKLSPM